MTKLLTSGATHCRVSSTLNRDSRQYGKKFMFDDDDETCWNSDQGTGQWVSLKFESPIIPEEIRVTFQGGFVGKECRVLGGAEGHELTHLADLYPEDTNSPQIFPIRLTESTAPITELKLIFASSTDFYGRITIYSLAVLGEDMS